MADRLDYLADLGVTAIYLNPIFSSASNHRYHTYDYLQVDPLLGGDAALRELLDRAHAKGIRVVLDGVFNHASRGFWPFNHVLECGLGSPYRGLVPRRPRGTRASGPPAPRLPGRVAAPRGRARAGRAATSASSPSGRWATGPGGTCRRSPSSTPTTRRSASTSWASPSTGSASAPTAGAWTWPAEIDDDEFWREFRRRVKAINPEAYIVAEIWHEDHRWLQGDQFDAYMNYPLGFAALSFAAAVHRDQRGHRPARRRARRRAATTTARRFLAASSTAHDVRPGDRGGPAQPARQPRHAADPHDLRRRPRRRAHRDPRPDDGARRAVHLLRRRDRPGRRPGPRLPRRVPGRRGGVGPRTLVPSCRACSRPAPATRSCAAGPSPRAGAQGMAAAYVALRRRRVAFVDRAQRRRGGRPAASVPARASSGRARLPVVPAGWPWPRRRARGPRSIDGRAARDRPARAGARPRPGACADPPGGAPTMPTRAAAPGRPGCAGARSALAGRPPGRRRRLAGCAPAPAPTPRPPALSASRAGPLGRRRPRRRSPRTAPIDEAGLAHDSRSDAYRDARSGRCPPAPQVTLRLRATAGDLTGATAAGLGRARRAPGADPDGGRRERPDRGRARLRLLAGDDPAPPRRPPSCGTGSSSATGRRTRYVEDDPPAPTAATARRAATAAPGASTRTASTRRGRSTSTSPTSRRPPGRTAPSSTRSSRTASPTATRRTTPPPTPGREPTARTVFRYGDVYGNPVLAKAWGDLPEGYCRAYQGVTCDEEPARAATSSAATWPASRRKLDDLARARRDRPLPQPDLRGAVEPPLRHEQLRRTSTRTSGRRPTSTRWSPRRRRAGSGSSSTASSTTSRRTRPGSTASAGSPRSAPARPADRRVPRLVHLPRARSPTSRRRAPPPRAGGEDTYYIGWFGFDTIPELVEQPARRTTCSPGPTGSCGEWIGPGTAGWRLDVMDNLSHGFMRDIRDAAKATDPDALVLGEQWRDASAWLLGDQADTHDELPVPAGRHRPRQRRHRRPRRRDRRPDAVAVRGADAGVREDYPAPAFDALLNLVDSHDTTRILWTLAPGADNPAAKESGRGPGRGARRSCGWSPRSS